MLDPSPGRRRKKDGIADLEGFEGGTIAEKVAMKVRKAAIRGMAAASVEGWLSAEVPAINDAIAELSSQGVIKRYGDTLIHADAYESFRQVIKEKLENFHLKNPLKPGMSKEELRATLRMEPKVFSSLMASLDEVSMEKDILRLKAFKASVSDEDKSRVLKVLDEKGLKPPSKDELGEALKMDSKRVGDIMGFLNKEGTAMRINDSLSLSRASYDKMIELLKAHFSKQPDMTVAEFRDILGTTRKYALPYLEYLDSNNITLRVGDVRKFILK